MDQAMNLKELCRICLESNKQSVDIYSKNRLYAEMLSSCTKIKPSEDDGLPHLICKECGKQLKRTYLFNIQCEESDKTLKYVLESLLDTVKTENITSANDKIDELTNEQQVENYDVKNETNDTENDETGWDADEQINDYEGITWKAEDSKVLVEIIPQETEEKLAIEEKVKKKRGRKKKDDKKLLPMSKRPHVCDICGKLVSTKSNLKAHKICHTDQRPYKCTECSATFKAYSALFQHRKIHTGETPYHCEYCPKKFARRTALMYHIKMHKGDKEFKCDICEKCFTQKSQLHTHIKRHMGDKSYLCQECGKGFPMKAELQVHQRTHSGEKPYSCHLCPKTFATSGNLSIHVRIHKKEVRYRCKECDRGFVTCSTYNVHMKRHKGQRDYNCDCGKSFYTSSALKQHRVVHTGEKNYQCKLCNRKFSQGSHLGRHFRRDHATPGQPMPTSDYYKLVLSAGHRAGTEIFNEEKEQSENVKCEGS